MTFIVVAATVAGTWAFGSLAWVLALPALIVAVLADIAEGP